jgi:predicted kinase
MMVLVGGFPGSGKTYFAKRLADRINAHHLSSDTVRRSLHAGGKYDIADKLFVYRALAAAAETKLNEAQTRVVIDATFSHREMRELFLEVAKKNSVSLRFIWLYADEELIKERTRGPREDSEADYSVYLKIRDEAEPWNMPHLSLESTNNNIETMLSKAITYLFSHETK